MAHLKKGDKITVSLTDFLDFLQKTGRSKQVKVKQIKERPDYHPGFDFWKPLRDGLVEFHEKGIIDKKSLDQILKELKDNKKLKLYPSLISSYKRFIGRKKFSWFTPPSGVFQHNELLVRVNPELGLILGDKRFVIKLYFKSDVLTKSEAELGLTLMHRTLSIDTEEKYTFCILDVQRGKLHICDFKPELLPLLEGEALSFQTIGLNLP